MADVSDIVGVAGTGETTPSKTTSSIGNRVTFAETTGAADSSPAGQPPENNDNTSSSASPSADVGKGRHRPRRNWRQNLPQRIKERQRLEQKIAEDYDEADEKAKEVQEQLLREAAEAKAAEEKLEASLTFEKLKSLYEDLVIDNMKDRGITPLSGVPNNGDVHLVPIAYCDGCVDRLAYFLEDEDVSGAVTNGGKNPVYIEQRKKLVRELLADLKFRMYDHVTVESFNKKGMEAAGKLHRTPIRVAAAIDGENPTQLCEKLLGEQVNAARYSTGVIMNIDMTATASASENIAKTHGQVVRENVDAKKTRNGCFCFKSDDWIGNIFTSRMCASASNDDDDNDDEEEEKDIGIKTAIETETEAEETKKKQENDEENGEEEEIGCRKNVLGDDDEHERCESPEEKDNIISKNDIEEEKPERVDTEEDDDDQSVGFDSLERNPRHRMLCEDDSVFRASKQIPVVLDEKDYENAKWSAIRSPSTCLSLCRHEKNCVIDTQNKAKFIKHLKLALIPKTEAEREFGIASTIPDEYYVILPNNDNYLAFSMGATIYEMFANEQVEDKAGDSWSCSSVSVSNISDACSMDINSESLARDELVVLGLPTRLTMLDHLYIPATAKVYATVHTVAMPFMSPPPVSDIKVVNNHSSFETFRVPLAADFSGRYSDKSIGFRSKIYTNLVKRIAETECIGDFKRVEPLYKCFQKPGAWASPPYIRVEGGVVNDDTGNKSGNYLYNFDKYETLSGSVASSARYVVRNINTSLMVLKKMVDKIFSGPFKSDILAVGKLHQEREAYVKKLGAEVMTRHARVDFTSREAVLHNKTLRSAETAHRYINSVYVIERDAARLNELCSEFLFKNGR